MALIYKEYLLDEAVVDEISADLQNFLVGIRVEKRDIVRIRLTVEELLLNIKGCTGEKIKISVGLGKQFRRHILRLRYEGGSFDPTKNSDNPWSDDIMRSLGYDPSWSYRGKVNTVSLVLLDRPKRSAVFYIVLAVLAAELLGVAGTLFPDTLRQSLCDGLLAPIVDCFLGLMTTFSGLMIAFTICSGILGMGDPAVTGRMGRSVMLRMLGISFAVSIVTAAMLQPFLHLNYSAQGQEQVSQLSQISRMFFDILPPNIIDPFRTGNALQIIVISILAGVALLAIGERAGRVCELIHESAALMQRIISTICALAPFFVFSLLLLQIWSGEVGRFISILKPMLFTFTAVLALAAALWLISSLRLKCSPLLLLKKTLPPALVAFTTSSSVSAMTLSMETCEKKLGVKKSMVSFVYPLGSVIYMPASVVYFTVLAFSCAEIYQVDVSLSWFVMAVVVSTLLVIALPPIPGAGMLGFTVLFSSLGIPPEALALATATNILFEFYDTGFNVMLLIFQMVCESKRTGNLGRDVLLNEEAGLGTL